MKVHLQGFKKIPRGKKLEVIHVANSISARKGHRCQVSLMSQATFLSVFYCYQARSFYLRTVTCPGAPRSAELSLCSPTAAVGLHPQRGVAPGSPPAEKYLLILKVKTSNRGCSQNATMSLFNHIFRIL